MFHKDGNWRRAWRQRAFSLFLAAVLLLGSVPGLAVPAAAHWADPYLDKLVDWGVMRADQTKNPDSPLTRAEFMAIINRAYGYKEVGPMPFEDVSRDDWFYDDVAIAYTAGYMKGTSDRTASPNAQLTREQAVCILGRNMMLKETPGEDLAFSDSRNISGWARGMVKTAVNNFIVSGYPDDTFRPKSNITKGQMAVLVTQCVGAPVQEPGTYTLGGVFGNVTVTSPNVTLRDTTVSGDLYVSGGVGLGGVKLENVNVLGRIVVSGTGESETGAASVVMRNVAANELLVDNMRNQYVTVRADGITEIAKTIVRTNAYLEDNNTDDKGLLNISLEGEPGTRLDLAGRIKTVVDKTPDSFVQVAKGSVQSLTVDEAATNTTVQINRNTEVKQLNLDVATNVNGEGDIGKLNVNAPGSTVTMLPDEIYIRPGITGNINGVVMDSAAAEESSLAPRLLSGYPAANDLAPTGFRADFAGNKRGTVYWAVSAIADGSIGAEQLISPPSYGSKAVRTGSVSVPAGDTTVNTQVTGLTVGGSYYLSAVLVDGRDERSPVKVISFTTPDNSKPAFAQGYPYMSLVTDTMAQVTVMPTKTCKLYYAVLPKGAKAPTASEMRSNSVTGNLGYGIVDVVKNTERVINVSSRLAEMKEYTLYLWLTDADGANSSAVTPVQFKTVDKTPPKFVALPHENGQVQATSVPMAATLNEDGTIYWVVVAEGEIYPKPNSQNAAENEEDGKTAKLDSSFAKLQVSSGMSALRSGKVTAKANTQVNIPISGLQAEKSYDLYYVAQDQAGNFSEAVGKITIHTLDNSRPVVRQYFSEYSGQDNTVNPRPNTDIILEFSEAVRSTASKSWVELKGSELAAVLHTCIELYQDTGDGRPKPVFTEVDTKTDWIIDFTKAKVGMENGKMLLTFPKEGLNLSSGATYYFRLKNITDTSNGQNPMLPSPVDYTNMSDGGHQIPRFTTVFAQVSLSNPGVGASDAPQKRDSAGQVLTGTNAGDAYVDLSFRMSPQATEKVQEQNSYEVYLWSDTIVKYNLYYRIVKVEGTKATPVTKDIAGSKGSTDPKNPDLSQFLLESKSKEIDSKGWVYLGNSGEVNPQQGELAGKGLNRHFNKLESNKFPPLKNLSESYDYEFAIEMTEMVGSGTRETWNGQVSFDVYVAAGLSSTLHTLGTGLNMSLWKSYKELGLNNGGIVSIGLSPQNTEYLRVRQLFTDTQLPEFATGRPEFPESKIGDSFATINLSLDRAGKIYYVIAPVGEITTTITKGSTSYSNADAWKQVAGVDGDSSTTDTLPAGGKPSDMGYTVNSPSKLSVYMRTEYTGNSLIHTGVINYPGGGSNYELVLSQATQKVLQPNQEYFAYFVLQGTAQEYSEVYCYRFKTTDVNKPKILLYDVGSGHVNVNTPNAPGDLDYAFWTSYNLSSNNVLKWKLSEHKAKDIPSAYLKYKVVENGTEVEKDMTLLQAILTNYDHTQVGSAGDSKLDGYSVFDVYADDTVKSMVRDLIQSRNQNSPHGGGNDFITEKDIQRDITAENIALNQMEKNTPYTILVTGRHPSSSDITFSYSFKGRDNIIIPDQAAPNATSAGGSIEHDGAKKFSGTVTIRFDKELYWVSRRDSPTALPVHQGCGDTGKNTTCIDIVDYVSKGGVTITAAEKVQYVTNSLSFKYSDMSEGMEFSFVSRGDLCNYDRIPMDGDIVCKLEKVGETKGDSNMITRDYQLRVYWDIQGKRLEIGHSATLSIKDISTRS